MNLKILKKHLERAALETQLQTQATQHTELYQAAQAQTAELERLNQLKDNLLNTVSHELRSPLTNMKLAIQMLEQQFQFVVEQAGTDLFSQSDLQKILSYLNILRSQCLREMQLINHLLDLRHLETGHYPLFPEILQLSSYLPVILDSFWQRTSERQQILQVQAAPDLPAIQTDALLLERILTELLTNACKYTPSGAVITVTIQTVNTQQATVTPLPLPSGIQICVSNTGIEIPVEALPQIFEPFYRVPKSDRWKQGGSGLGLALVQKMVQWLQGTIHVKSADNLTEFIVELPLTLLSVEE